MKTESARRTLSILLSLLLCLQILSGPWMQLAVAEGGDQEPAGFEAVNGKGTDPQQGGTPTEPDWEIPYIPDPDEGAGPSVLPDMPPFPGAGTEEDPFLLSSPEDLLALAAAVEAGRDYADGAFLLEADVTLDAAFPGIGTPEKPFTGVFDGGTHTVTLEPGEEENRPVFCAVRGAVIRRLGVEGELTSSEQSLGAIAGTAAESRFEDCYAAGTVSYIEGDPYAVSDDTAVIPPEGNPYSVTSDTVVVPMEGDPYSSADDTAVTVPENSPYHVSNDVVPVLGGLVGNAEGSVFVSCFAYNPASGLGLTGNGGTAENSFYLVRGEAPAAPAEEGRPGEGLNTRAFRSGEAVWLLNGGPEHRNVWAQGEDYPVFGDEETLPTVRVLLREGEESYGGVTLAFLSEDGEENSEAYAAPGTKLALTAHWASEAPYREDLILPEGVVPSEEQDQYIYTVPEEDAELTYIYVDDPGLDWYINDPSALSYTLYTVRQLRGFASLVNGTAEREDEPLRDTFLGRTVFLGRDVDLLPEKYGDWTPIGAAETPFAGTFDGRSSAVKNFKIGDWEESTDASDLGFFGYVSGSVMNLHVSGEIWTTGDRVGSVAASAATGAMIYACSADTELHGGSFVGGLVGEVANDGYNGALFTFDSYSGQIYASGSNVGGILGGGPERKYTVAVLRDCENSGIVYAPGGENVGGIVGYADYIPMESCRNSGPVQGSRYLGGIAGYERNGEIRNCSNTGKLLNGRTVGGIVGWTYGNITSCYNLGEITSTMQAGGIVGTYTFLNTFRNCYSFHPANDGLPLAGSVQVSDPNYLNYYPDCCYYDSSAAETKAEWRGATALPAEAFVRGGALWFLNGGADHRDSWVQGEGGPILRGEAEAETVCRLTVKPAGEAAAAEVTVRFPEEQAYFLAGVNRICLPQGENAELTVEWQTEDQAETEEELITRTLVFQPADAVTRAEDEAGRAHYWVYAVSADVDVVYSVLEEDETGYGWYLSDPEAETFLLHSAKQLYALAAIVNGTAVNPFTDEPMARDDFRRQTILLAADMELTEEWTPIGTEEAPFAGIMDGSGAVIRGLRIGTEEAPAQGDNLGFFGVLSAGCELRGLTVLGEIYAEGDNVGGIAGLVAGGSIINCRFGTDNEASLVEGRDRVGGIAGYVNSAWQLSGNNNYASVTGRDSVGGIFGEAKGGFNQCENHGPVTGRDGVGGVLGKGSASAYEPGHLYLKNTGAVSGRDSVGGLIGELYTQRRLAYGQNSGSVAASGSFAGGVAGRVTWEPYLSEDSINMDRLTNSGAVSGLSYVGGAFGSIQPVAGLRRIRGSLQLVDNHGSVTASANEAGESYAGGLFGYCALPYHYSPFTSTYEGVDYACGNSGSVSGAGAYVGGVTGYMAANLEAGTTAITNYPAKPINTGAVSGGDYTGGLAGYAAFGITLSGNKQDCLVNTGAVAGRDFVGGFAGESAGAITGAAQNPMTNLAPVTGRNCIGGIVGRTNQAVTLAQNEGSISASGTAGGIAGALADSGSIVNSFAAGRVYSVEADVTPILGGLAGEVSAETSLRGSYYANAETLLPLTGSGFCAAADCFYLWEGEAPEGWLGLPAAEEDFASGYVAWQLDGGRLSRSRVWTQGEGRPELAEDRPVWRLRLTRGNEAPEGCALTVAPSNGYTVLTGEDGAYTLYAVSGSVVSLVTELTGTYKVTLAPKPEGTATQAGYDFPLDRDYDVTYRFYQQVNADYAWYFDAPEGATNYVIKNEAELLSFANLVNGTALDASGELLIPNDFLGKTVRLGADIRWTGAAWTPAGTAETPFRGTFDGDGHGILDLFVTGGSGLGLFGYVQGAAIQNLTVAGDVYNMGKHTGGLAARAVDSDFVNCTSAMTITGEGEHSGGLVGEGELCRFLGCAFTGTLSGWSDGVGGIIGSGGPGLTLEECENSGSVTGGGSHTGGLAGRAGDQATLTGNRNSGPVTGVDSVGGLAGSLGNSAVLEDCVNAANVESGYSRQDFLIWGGTAVGGVVGLVGEGASLVGCVNAAPVNACGTYVGGVVGRLGADLLLVENCRNEGDITVTPAGQNDGHTVGGVIGSFASIAEGGVISRCVNLGAVSARSSVGGVAGVAGVLLEGQLVQSLNYGAVSAAGERAESVGGIVAAKGYQTKAGPDRCVNLGLVTLNGNKSNPITGYGAACPGCFFLRSASANDRNANRRVEADFASGRVAYELDTLRLEL